MDGWRNLFTATLRTYPYHWAYIEPIGNEQNLQRLAAEFPRTDFRSSERGVGVSGDGKAYRLSARTLHGRGMRELAVADLTRSWSKLLGELCSPVYSSALGSLAGVDLSGAGLEVTCWLYGPGDWLGSHTDKADKIVTQVFNLNAQWEGTWGGCLRILRSADTRDVHAEIAPKANSSVVLVRSDRSWHCVTPVRAEANSLRSRQVLTATFYREGSRGDDPGLGKHG